MGTTARTTSWGLPPHAKVRVTSLGPVLWLLAGAVAIVQKALLRTPEFGWLREHERLIDDEATTRRVVLEESLSRRSVMSAHENRPTAPRPAPPG
jgi:hypothetical protein